MVALFGEVHLQPAVAADVPARGRRAGVGEARQHALDVDRAPLAGQDMLQLVDGRFVQGAGIKMTRTPEGVKIHFKNGDVLVRKPDELMGKVR